MTIASLAFISATPRSSSLHSHLFIHSICASASANICLMLIRSILGCDWFPFCPILHNRDVSWITNACKCRWKRCQSLATRMRSLHSNRRPFSANKSQKFTFSSSTLKLESRWAVRIRVFIKRRAHTHTGAWRRAGWEKSDFDTLIAERRINDWYISFRRLPRYNRLTFIIRCCRCRRHRAAVPRALGCRNY